MGTRDGKGEENGVTTREVEVVMVGQVVATLPNREKLRGRLRIESKPVDRLFADLKVQFGERNVFFHANLGKRTCFLPLDRFFLGEPGLRILMGSFGPSKKTVGVEPALHAT